MIGLQEINNRRLVNRCIPVKEQILKERFQRLDDWATRFSEWYNSDNWLSRNVRFLSSDKVTKEYVKSPEFWDGYPFEFLPPDLADWYTEYEEVRNYEQDFLEVLDNLIENGQRNVDGSCSVEISLLNKITRLRELC